MSEQQASLTELALPVWDVFVRLTGDEFALILTTFLSLGMGAIAALQVLTGTTMRETGQADRQEDLESGAIAALSNRTEAALDVSETKMRSAISRVEQQISDVQRAHDTRFADLHKDLAGIVWELSKLRADMARWQVLMHAYGNQIAPLMWPMLKFSSMFCARHVVLRLWPNWAQNQDCPHPPLLSL